MKLKNSIRWNDLIIGLLLIVLGVVTIIHPEGILTSAVVIYGIIAVVIGIEDLLKYVSLSRFVGIGPTLSLISGILSVMCGAMIIARPNVGKWALTILFPIWFIAHCVSKLTRANFMRKFSSSFYYFLSMILNIIGIVLGIVMFFSPSLSFMSIKVVCYIAAVYLIFFGVENIVMAFNRRGDDYYG